MKNQLISLFAIICISVFSNNAHSYDNDMDNDGIMDRYDNDMDNDGIMDRYDNDMDNDGIFDRY